MNLQLKRLRKLAGFKTQAAIAKKLGVKERTYASWEREEAVMSLEQSIAVADLLDCSLDELAGRWDYVKKPVYGDPREQELVACYESMSEPARDSLLRTAQLMSEGDASLMEKKHPDLSVDPR